MGQAGALLYRKGMQAGTNALRFVSHRNSRDKGAGRRHGSPVGKGNGKRNAGRDGCRPRDKALPVRDGCNDPTEGECIYAVPGATGHGTHVVMHNDTKAATWPDRGAPVAVMDPHDMPVLA
ncbi:hypothetical protein Geu3261_0031_010 [Komagataeibacter europaeus NBRC 3261]|uniref:Uncharacterized protein n=1 Tax=Komagataeibacter europaeus NBRC 3261 TaxID=1234669 RepID=A0A0D6PXV9_KOMEU|nr:hypothetical protein Geu3261_0031_010 [Komagataeibacter europaeus NBRC 3261]